MSILSNPHIVIPFLAFIIAQTMKLMIKAKQGGTDWKVLLSAGNMPSSHSAIVMALLVVLYFVDGPDTAVFGIGAVLASIVIYDSLNVRRAVGEQGGIISKMIEMLKIPSKNRSELKLREVLGHNPLEVLAGALIGFVTGFVFTFNYWPQNMKDFLNNMGDLERTIYYILFAVVLVVGIIINRYFSRKKYRKLPTSKNAKRLTQNVMIISSILGLMAVWLESKDIRFFATKFWIFSLIIWVICGFVYGYFKVLRPAKNRLKEEALYFEKNKKLLKKLRTKKSKRRK